MKRKRPKSVMVPLDGLLALDAVAVVAGQSAEIRAAIKAGEVETLSDRDFPPIARGSPTAGQSPC